MVGTCGQKRALGRKGVKSKGAGEKRYHLVAEVDKKYGLM